MSRANSNFHHNGKSTDFEQTLGPGTTINLNALTCYGLVSSEVSHRIATMVSRHVVHTDNTDLHIPATRSGVRKPRNPSGPLRHMCHIPYCSHLEAHSPV
ncbi:TPA: hypothetical protein I4G93_26465 [Enterobacter hormaechei subsp. xiangfangensis]|nr:hypothetical protein [Enterobacter hormaechei subsp. xiangfangensis]HAS1807716.1 hypothetical protein [Enterobacter hormaechei subsp. xiangfangensis]HAS1819166.1 hypothetical protein [Enterobacter hormaechei subsp. xiangfangensis]HAS1824563.1 hypothetical protein [Enterobacter hormaechei subsp. xiangfangensis]HAS1829161.1 hypothetical protein [Enterobacter hormaechei subsp. xiangfangensis]